MRSCLRPSHWAFSGAGCSPAPAEPRAEVLERSLEAHLRRIEFAHGRCEPGLGAVLRPHIACLRDELHRSYRGLVVSVREHVEVGVGHALAVERARGLRERTVGELSFAHQDSERFSEWLDTHSAHGCSPGSYFAVQQRPRAGLGVTSAVMGSRWRRSRRCSAPDETPCPERSPGRIAWVPCIPRLPTRTRLAPTSAATSSSASAAPLRTACACTLAPPK